jgi:hypothetical protein
MKKLIFSGIPSRCEWLFLVAFLFLSRSGLAQSSGTNLVVNIDSPTNEEIFIPMSGLPPDIYLIAKTSDSDASVTNVEYFAGTNLIGQANPVVLDPPGVNGVTGPVWFLAWFTVPAGNYTLTAVATDDQGLSATSPAVNITVEGATTNLTVNIVSPTNGELFSFTSGAESPEIQLIAQGADSGGTITNVEYFAGTNLLGEAYLIVLDPPGVNGVTGPVWILTWAGVPAGAYVLTAVAADNQGASATSPPVNITVQDFGTNPLINIVSPTNGEVFDFPAFNHPSIQITGSIADAAGTITNVEFFADGNLLGQASFFTEETWAPAFFTWVDPPAGAHRLTGVATDNQGNSTTSAPVNITVEGGGSGALPIVRITSPANNAVFRAPVDIPITAFAYVPAGGPFLPPGHIVTNIQFFAGTNDLGYGRKLSGRYFGSSNYFTLPYQFGLTWSNAPAGAYPLTAVATDNSDSSTSVVVNITILPAKPPATNLPDVISIVATDPIAVAGSNSWVWAGPTNPPTWTTWPPTRWQSFTNWGPKDALFTVSRYGAISNDLDVPCSIGGTATNGVDYSFLPGSVTIPAGASSALIAIVPIDNGPAPAKTVILTLTPSTNVPPGYIVGFPAHAEALIIENWLRPLPYLLPGGSFNFNEAGPDGAWFRADWSSDLLNWTPLCTNEVFDGSIDFLDADAAANPLRYYRAVPLDGPP